MDSIDLLQESQVPVFGEYPREWYPVVKQAMDLVVCILLLPVALVMMAIIALAIVVDSPGSPFFLQERVGKDGRRFRIFKFRTMSRDYDSHANRTFMQAFVSGELIPNTGGLGEACFKPPITNHITRVGSILRRTSLDELPQIFNVLLGEMSLIGPRPNVPWEVEKYSDSHYLRLAVQPGITGLAQVRGRSSISFDEIVQYDLEYIQGLSLRLDLQILWLTITSVLSMNGSG